MTNHTTAKQSCGADDAASAASLLSLPDAVVTAASGLDATTVCGALAVDGETVFGDTKAALLGRTTTVVGIGAANGSAADAAGAASVEGKGNVGVGIGDGRAVVDDGEAVGVRPGRRTGRIDGAAERRMLARPTSESTEGQRRTKDRDSAACTHTRPDNSVNSHSRLPSSPQPQGSRFQHDLGTGTHDFENFGATVSRQIFA